METLNISDQQIDYIYGKSLKCILHQNSDTFRLSKGHFQGVTPTAEGSVYN